MDVPIQPIWAARRRRNQLANAEERAAFLFMSPWFIGLIFFLVVPLVYATWISLTDEQLLRVGDFVGLDNYATVLTNDDSFWTSMRVTLSWVVMTTPLFMTAGLGVALLLNQKLPGMNVFRTILYIPAVLSGVAVAILWFVLLNGEFGAVNQLLRAIGIANPPYWFEDPTWAMPALAIVGLWGIGGNAVIYLAGLQNIPPHLYEAASIDGAGDWAKFRQITLPMLSPTLFFILINSLVGAILVFPATVFVISGGTFRGGPDDSLLFAMYYIYRKVFIEGLMGYGTAVAWLLTLAGCVVVFVAFRLERRFVYYETQ
jgi:multiple sugar transport system permease protein